MDHCSSFDCEQSPRPAIREQGDGKNARRVPRSTAEHRCGGFLKPAASRQDPLSLEKSAASPIRSLLIAGNVAHAADILESCRASQMQVNPTDCELMQYSLALDDGTLVIIELMHYSSSTSTSKNMVQCASFSTKSAEVGEPELRCEDRRSREGQSWHRSGKLGRRANFDLHNKDSSNRVGVPRSCWRPCYSRSSEHVDLRQISECLRVRDVMRDATHPCRLAVADIHMPLGVSLRTAKDSQLRCAQVGNSLLLRMRLWHTGSFPTPLSLSEHLLIVCSQVCVFWSPPTLCQASGLDATISV